MLGVALDQQAVEAAHGLLAALRLHRQGHEVGAPGLSAGGRHAETDEHEHAREDDKPHALPRSADRVRPLISTPRPGGYGTRVPRVPRPRVIHRTHGGSFENLNVLDSRPG